MYVRPILLSTLLCIACAISASYEEVINDPTRLSDARERDAVRKPAEILRFSGLQVGNTVVEIAPAGGYYTALVSRVVGPEGEVIAIDPERVFEYFPKGREGFPAYIERDPRDNVTYKTDFLDTVELPAGVDQIWMVLYYHDTIWTGEDRAAMNQRFFDALRTGGTYLVIDHHALTGAPNSVTQELHRGDAAMIRAEIEAAGFILSEESRVLSNPEDPRDDSVFGEVRRGNTDRFVWRFSKP